jgi:peptide/nickel transport system substrate-binding protein
MAGDNAAVAPINEGDSEPVQGDWIIVSREAEADNLNRVIGTNTYSAELWTGPMGSFIGETLLGYDARTWRIERPLLAESYPEITSDNLTYTFTMREGVRWHDGEPFTAEDVLFSIKVTMLPFVDSASLRSYFGDLADVRVDGREIEFSMSRPYWMNAEVLGFTLVILPKHVFDPEGVLDNYSYTDVVSSEARNDDRLRMFGEQFNRHPSNRSPIGTGPWKFERWESGSEIVLTRNEDYWGEEAYLDRLVYRIITDSTAALTALKAGETDMFPRMTPIQWAQQTDDANFNAQFTKTNYRVPSFTYVGWNAERPFFSDYRVRKAMTMLIPRQRIIDTIRFGLADIAVSPFNPSSPDFNPNIQAWAYDPAEAVRLLEEVGWIDSDGNGIRDKDGVEFSFEMQSSSGSQFAQQFASILRDEFQRVGIDMDTRLLEFTTLVENARDHRFDANMLGWISDLSNDPYQLWHSSQAQDRGSNYVSFVDEEADRLIEEARTEFDPDRRRELYWRFQEIIHEQQPYTFVMYSQESAAYHQRFQNVEWIPPYPGFDLTKWFVRTGAQRFSEFSPQ